MSQAYYPHPNSQPPNQNYPYDIAVNQAYPFPYSNQQFNQRPLPPTQPQQLMSSAENTKTLLSDAQVINETLRHSHSFADQLTKAAQQSQHQIVHDLINNLPIQNRAVLSFSPGGISITLMPKSESNSCCYIVLFLNWKDSF